MARKPNFRFERQERERVHAEKRAARDALKEQRKAEMETPVGAVEQSAADGAASVVAAPAPAAASQPGRPAPPDVQLSEAQKGAVTAAMKALETMTPEEVAILHQNAVRLATTGSAKQRAAAQELLPRLEAELQRLGEAKRQAAAARLAGGAKRPKKQ